MLRGRTFGQAETRPCRHRPPRRSHQRIPRARSLAQSGSAPSATPSELFGNMDGDLRLLTIVGIVGDTHVYGLEAPPRPTVYVNLLQRPQRRRHALTRRSVNLPKPRFTGHASAARCTVLSGLDRKFPPNSAPLQTSIPIRWARGDLTSSGRIFWESPRCCFAARRRVWGSWPSYSVSRRIREVGVRIAVGAWPEISTDPCQSLGRGLPSVLHWRRHRHRRLIRSHPPSCSPCSLESPPPRCPDLRRAVTLLSSLSLSPPATSLLAAPSASTRSRHSATNSPWFPLTPNLFCLTVVAAGH